MVKILYFAWLRTKVGVGEESVSPPDGVKTVGDLVIWLASRSEGHRATFAELDIIRVAVNQDHVRFDHPLHSGDEIAFFPPVTGG